MISTTAFPTQRLVIGVLVTRRVEEHDRVDGPAWVRLNRFVSGKGGDLDRHAWVARVALVVAAWWCRTEPGFLPQNQTLPKEIN